MAATNVAAIPVSVKSTREREQERKEQVMAKKVAKTPAKLTGAAAAAKAKKAAGGGKEKAPKVEKACLCGCGEKTFAYFVPGHDARFKGWMVKVERGKMQVNELPKSVQKAYEFKKRGPGFVTATNYKGERHGGYDRAE